MDKPVSAVVSLLSDSLASGDGTTSSAGAAAARMYVDHGPLLRRIAIRKFHVPVAEAEALVHDVFINYLATPRNVTADLRAYLIAAICNACRNYWRARNSEERIFAAGEELEPAAIARDDKLFESLTVNLVVAATLARLGSRCREALKRYYLRGEDTPTVAAAMHTSAGNVNYLMHVCRKKARAIYEQITRVG